MTFKVGDRVRISPNSGYYNDGWDKSNPVNEIGTVQEVLKVGPHNILVMWEKLSNVYRIKDLIYAIPPKLEDYL